MIKSKKRYCDICKEEMPMYIDFNNPNSNPHDIISVGFKTKSGRTMNKNYDVCSNCMGLIDELLSGQQAGTN